LQVVEGYWDQQHPQIQHQEEVDKMLSEFRLVITISRRFIFNMSSARQLQIKPEEKPAPVPGGGELIGGPGIESDGGGGTPGITGPPADCIS
jgi:hypothetical protein